MKKAEINLIRSFMAIQENITQHDKILSDKYDGLKLSHNRKTKALNTIKTMLENYPLLETDQPFKEKILKICNDALWSNGRMKEKPFSYYKKFKNLSQIRNQPLKPHWLGGVDQ